MSCAKCGCSTLPCNCCSGIETLTPVVIDNRAGLEAISYRVGTHGQFMDSMLARLSTITLDAPGSDGQTIQTWRPLQGLTTRDPSDPSIALLDCWACVGDVLSFYQERIANEGYLRTCTERLSAMELGRLIGYEPRPGVAASVYVAYTIDPVHTTPTVIQAGARSQTLPGPGELPQSFETSEDLEARAEWNNLQPRLTKPQPITLMPGTAPPDISVDGNNNPATSIYIDGTDAALRPGDRLLFLFDTSDLTQYAMRSVSGTSIDYTAKRTRVDLQPLSPLSVNITSAQGGFGFLGKLLAPANPQVANSLNLSRTLSEGFLAQTPQLQALRVLGAGGKAAFASADGSSQLLVNFAPRLRETYYKAWASTPQPTAAPLLAALFVMRSSVGLFGDTAPQPPPRTSSDNMDSNSDWLLQNENAQVASLDQADEAIAPGSYVAILKQAVDGRTQATLNVFKVTGTQTRPRTDYGLSSKTTQLTLGAPWWKYVANATSGNDTMATLRTTQVYARSESLTPVDAPVLDDVKEQTLELDGLYRELQSGRWVIVSGERTDIPDVTGVNGSELLMISSVTHGFDPSLPNDKTHTTLSLATSMAYKYKLDTVYVYGNVVKATHGETRNEALGSGSGQALQSFALRQRPLTYVSAPNAAGAASSLHVFVNGVEWHETDALAGLAPTDRRFVTETDDSGVTTVLFGDGDQGARPPTGMENVTAVYRTGIGLPGNVQAEQITLLQTKPLGVKSIVNPLEASGGADREDLDQVRQNAPLAVMALDRLVSVKDYADFARTFAGIAKAIAQQTTDGHRELIYLTIAAVADADIDVNSDLYRNLLTAFATLGDADLPVQVAGRERIALLLSAHIRIEPDYQWDLVVAAVRAALLDRFGFERRSLGQAAILSEMLGVMSAVDGVDYVDVDVFGGICDHRTDTDGSRVLLTPPQITDAVASLLAKSTTATSTGKFCHAVMAFPGGRDHSGVLRPAQLAIFTPDVPQALVLNQIV